MNSGPGAVKMSHHLTYINLLIQITIQINFIIIYDNASIVLTVSQFNSDLNVMVETLCYVMEIIQIL